MKKTQIWWTCFWKAAADLRTIFLVLLAADVVLYWWLKTDPTLLGMVGSISLQLLAYTIITALFARTYYKEVLTTMPWIK